jgi:hypothetical protein
MTPLDDELRSTLTRRADLLTASPDPLAGIEARVSRIRRRRAALAVSGAVAVVAAVALAVPALVPDRATRVQPGTTVTAAPGALPANALDTGDERGELVVAGKDKVADAWVKAHAATGPVYALTLLTATQLTTPPLPYAILEIWQQGGPAYAVVAQDTDTKPVLVRDSPLSPDAVLIDGVVTAADGKPFVVYTLAQSVTWLGYDKGDGNLHGGAFPPGGSSSGILDRTGPYGARDSLTARLTDGTSVTEAVWTEPIDDYAPPANVLTWEPRGDATESPAVSELAQRFAQALGRSPEGVGYRALYVGATDSGVRYTFGQAWFRGDQQAYTVSLATGGTHGDVFFLGPVTPKQPWGLAFLLGDLPGTSTDLLVVVPRPGTGQLSYAPHATGSFTPIANGRSDLDGIGYVTRAKDATDDRLQSLDGDGNLDRPLYEGPVAPLLCGLRECG